MEPSKLLPPSCFSQLVIHKLRYKLACIHNLREAILKHTMATHVKNSVATVMIPGCMDLIWDLLQSLQDHQQLYQQLLGMFMQAQLVADTCGRAMKPDCYVFIIQVDRTQAAVIHTDYGWSKRPAANTKLAGKESLLTSLVRLSSKRSLTGKPDWLW